MCMGLQILKKTIHAEYDNDSGEFPFPSYSIPFEPSALATACDYDLYFSLTFTISFVFTTSAMKACPDL